MPHGRLTTALLEEAAATGERQQARLEQHTAALRRLRDRGGCTVGELRAVSQAGIALSEDVLAAAEATRARLQAAAAPWWCWLLPWSALVLWGAKRTALSRTADLEREVRAVLARTREALRRLDVGREI